MGHWEGVRVRKGWACFQAFYDTQEKEDKVQNALHLDLNLNRDFKVENVNTRRRACSSSLASPGWPFAADLSSLDARLVIPGCQL